MGNPFSAIGNIGNMMKQAKEMQSKLKQVQDELAQAQITGEAGAGMIKITINGNGEALNVEVADSALSEDKKILQGLIAAAVNDANHKRDLKKKEIMSVAMAGMGLPEGMDLPGGLL